jgi:hypothetical protein
VQKKPILAFVYQHSTVLYFSSYTRRGKKRTKGNLNLKRAVASSDYGRSKRPENMGYFNSLVSVITSGVWCTREIKYRIAITTAAFKNKKSLFTS